MLVFLDVVGCCKNFPPDLDSGCAFFPWQRSFLPQCWDHCYLQYTLVLEYFAFLTMIA